MKEKILPDSLVEPLYSRIAKSHDLWATRAEKKAKERALALGDLKPEERVLEVGVGTGLLFVEVIKKLGERGFALGIDRTAAMLEKARERLGGSLGARFCLEQGDARALPLEDESFDVAFSCYLLDLLSEEDILRVLRELYRVLRPGGRLVLASMTHAERLWHSGYALLGRIDPRLFGGCRPILATPFLEKAGFRLVCREYVVESLFPSEVTLSIKLEG